MSKSPKILTTKESAHPKTLTVEESSAILAAVQCTNGTHVKRLKGIRNYAMCCMMLEAGLRVGEVVKLRCSHLWFNCQPVTSTIVTTDIAKNQKERQIPVSMRLHIALTLLHDEYWFWYELEGNHYAFAASNKWKGPSTRHVERIVARAGIEAIGRPVNPHIFRHTFASRLTRVTNIRNVQAMLGHASLSSTQVYTHPNADDLRTAIDAVG